ncbi:MAG: hypothetical protein WAU65_02690 [Candidatus Nanoarchaeia archaeon]
MNGTLNLTLPTNLTSNLIAVNNIPSSINSISPIWQAVITIVISITLFLITTFLKNRYLDPYFEFKKELKNTLKTLYRYNNILTNAFQEDRINDYFREKVLNAQDEVRKRWADLLVSRVGIKYTKTKLVKKLFENKIPTDVEITKIAENLLSISNSQILYFEQNAPEDISADCLDRDAKIKEITDILLKY